MSSSPSSSELASMLSVAMAAARVAGGLMEGARGSLAGTEVESLKSTYQDLVTATDKACEEAIGRLILAAFPTHAILGEESVAPGRDASKAAVAAVLASGAEFVWVVDPIGEYFIFYEASVMESGE